mgnify:CR=1 FL=1
MYELKEPGKGYSVFAGKDGSRGLGMSSLNPKDAVSDYSTLNDAQLKVLDDWVRKLEWTSNWHRLNITRRYVYNDASNTLAIQYSGPGCRQVDDHAIESRRLDLLAEKHVGGCQTLLSTWVRDMHGTYERAPGRMNVNLPPLLRGGAVCS